ncbi:cysteine hydrolase family protein [Dongia deserti]|uniref:cysteine hydrolase family protein n=1 Tax=Dongia deserti TaxID=2268030 RepID=UPI00254674A5|nr:isochorismatase family cysteine hydrolase [Dongia deserti]
MLIDMQRDFLEPQGYLAGLGYDLGGVRGAIGPAQQLLAAARAAGLCIIHTRQGYRPDLAEVPAHKLARIQAGQSAIGKPGPLGRFLIRGEPGFQIISELAPVPGEFVVDKTANSAFWGTDLAAILTARGIRALILAGVTTDVCVHCTLREANDRGFECLLAGDACGSGDAEAHRAALHMVTVEDGVFGVLADVDAIVTALDRMDRPIATPTAAEIPQDAVREESSYLGDWSI